MRELSELFADGGYSLWPTTLFGLLAVASAVAVALRPGPRFVPLLLWLGTLTTLSAGLGLCLGLAGVVDATVAAAPEVRAELITACTAQALVNVAVGLVLLAGAAMVATTGALRLAARPPPNAALS